MSSAVDLTERINGIFVEAVNIEIASPDQDLIESGLLDSLAFVEILLHIEREFGVDVSLAEFEIDVFRQQLVRASSAERIFWSLAHLPEPFAIAAHGDETVPLASGTPAWVARWVITATGWSPAPIALTAVWP